MTKVLKIAIVALVHIGLWMLFVDDLSIRDFVIGLVAVAVTTTAVVGAGRLMDLQFRPNLGELKEAWRIPWYAVSGTGEVMQALGKQLFTKAGTPSFHGAVAFDTGGDDARSAGRRAVATTYTTLTPNFVVLGYVRRGEGDEDPYGTDVMLYHQVIPGEVLQMTQNLGARP